jgi:hypothetical protein
MVLIHCKGNHKCGCLFLFQKIVFLSYENIRPTKTAIHRPAFFDPSPVLVNVLRVQKGLERNTQGATRRRGGKQRYSSDDVLPGCER